jgi:ectoine hydroxylase-related dioxygenase (phytanoyl-CoA dioxygenase family)
VALDKCNKKNGTIELSKAHKGDFYELYEGTKKDGTPALKKKLEAEIIFKPINLDVGDVVFFLNTCPHRSKKNKTKKMRRILYYTYSLAEYGSKYNKYFRDKNKSKNKLKALNNK